MFELLSADLQSIQKGEIMKLNTLLVVALLMTGCAARQTSITNLPPGVTQAQVQSWDTAVSNLDKIATANSSIRQAVIQLHNTMDSSGNPIFPSGPAYVTTLDMIGKIDQTENAAATFLNTVPNSWPASTKTTIANYMGAISTSLEQLNTQGVTGIKNPSSLTNINTLIADITASVTIILSL
jgi:hypothetical protein